MKTLLRLFGFLFAAGSIVFLAGVAAVAAILWHYSQDLPQYSQLRNYEPPVMTRVHAADGSLLAEYAKQRRLYLPIQAVPTLVKNAFIAAEDKNFYYHPGIDIGGILRASISYIEHYGSNRHPQGASTITQQVAKNFLLTNKVTFSRKIKEMLLALKIERAYSKDKILELYLNEIYLGFGSYGIAAASLLYFDESVQQLTIAQAAFLAGLPKGPNNYNPFRHYKEAVERRDYVIDRMVDDGFITAAQGAAAEKEPLKIKVQPPSPRIYAAEYFTEEVRRYLVQKYGESTLYEGGLSVRTTLEPKLQLLARKTLVDGLVKFDERKGYRGPITHIDISSGDWGLKLADVKSLSDIDPWRMAVVLDVNDNAAKIGFQPPRDPGGVIAKTRETGTVPLEGVKWARPAKGRSYPIRRVSQVLSPGDVIYVAPIDGKPGEYALRQVPQLSGAMVVEDPHTGRVLAMVGGFSFDESQFNRATQALRQPGSSFKPIVYAAAIDNGYTPSTIINDAPIEIDMGPSGGGIWKPQNYGGQFFGPSTLRFGLEESRNVMTVRLAQAIGMPLIAEYAREFGVYDNLPPYLSYALGAGDTTLMRMVNAYSILDNGGRRVVPTLIDRIQDRFGRTIYKTDTRECIGCNAKSWHNQPEPTLIAHEQQVLDPMTDYQIVSMMEGVVQYGTGTALRALGKPIAGKTGTTNDEKDVWFIGFSPDLVCGVYLGYDKPREIAPNATGGDMAAPIVRDFLKVALADKPPIPFPMPDGIKLVRVDAKTGLRAGPGDRHVILEAFKPGTAPPDRESVIGTDTANGRTLSVDNGPLPVSPDADRAVRSTGTGGLY
jgi:penicillin-binding protein 1A